MKESARFRLNQEDVGRWLKNTLIFLAPVLLIYLGSIVPDIQEAGLQVSDFAITPIVAGAMVLYVINVITDVLRKLISSN